MNLSPNIILINCDDLGYGDLEPYGATAIRTPHVNRLAQGGVRFTSFYACNALCTPSRYGLLTGRYPERSGFGWLVLPKRVGARGNESQRSFFADLHVRFGWRLYNVFTQWHFMDYGKEPASKGLQPHEITIASALRAAGYRTGMVGKWHLGEFPRYPEFNPIRHGFDFFYGVPHSNDMIDFALYRGEECLSPDFTQMDQLTGLYTREALQFIRASGHNPFFLYFAHTYPHQPLHASEKFRGKSPAGRYGDTVEEIDWSLGEIMQTLEEQKILDNTLVVFTSDNGPWYNGSPGGLRGRKNQSYEGGFRIPMIAHWPAMIPPGTVCHHPAMNIDWFPTCLSLAGLPLPEDRVIDGKNILGLLSGKETQSPHDCLYFSHNGALEAIRVGKWKYIPSINTGVWPIPLDKYWLAPSTEQAPWLYDLETDPTESYNMKDDHPDVIKYMDHIFRQRESEMKNW